MTILVSGATGFVGGTITRHLLDGGHSVRAMSRSTARTMTDFAANKSGRRALAEGRLTFVQADVTKPAALVGRCRAWRRCSRQPSSPERR